MSSNIFAILPDQLFTTKEAIDNISRCEEVYLLEDPYWFNNRMCKTKLVLLRAAMRNYHIALQELLSARDEDGEPVRTSKITYVNFRKIELKGGSAFDFLVGVESQVNMFRLSDVYAFGDKPWTHTYIGLPIRFHESPAWLLTYKSIRDGASSGHKYNQRNIEKKILAGMKLPSELTNGIVGGADEKKSRIFSINFDDSNPIFKNAVDYVGKNFTAVGTAGRYSISSEEADKLTDAFIEHILPKYMTGDIIYLATPLSLGLLTPRELLLDIIEEWKDPDTSIPTDCVRKFITDLLQREYFRVLYLADSDLMSKNTYNAKGKLPDGWYSGELSEKYFAGIVKKLLRGQLCSEEMINNIILYLTVNDVDPLEIAIWLRSMVPWCSAWNSAPMIPSIATSVRMPGFHYDPKAMPGVKSWQVKSIAFGLKYK